MDKEYAQYLLKKTIEDYNSIAEDYSRTREFTWDIENLVQYITEGDKILDLGCGNGRLLKVIQGKNIDYIGADQSEGLIEIAKRKYPEAKFQAVDAFNLPFPNNYFDAIFCIRAFHHVPSKELRHKFLAEVRRVLRPGGLLVMTVWYTWSRRSKENFWRVVKNMFSKFIGISKLDFGDAFVPWGKKATRYYHFFTQNELKVLLKENNFKAKEIGVLCRPAEITRMLGGHSCDIKAIAEK